jgi:hypothetical protein
MDMGFIRLRGSRGRSMRASGLMTRGTDKDIRGTKTAMSTGASSIIINRMGKALTPGLMERSTMVSGFTAARTASEYGAVLGKMISI